MTHKNKVALITGSTHGIGKATALEFAKQGAKIVLSDYQKDIDTLKSINEIGAESFFVQCDISQENEVKNLIETTIKHFGRIDYAFNNAGIEGKQALLHECPNENWNNVLNINLTGTWYCMKYQIPQMLKQGSGSIVNNASIAGLVGFQGTPAYVASKHAVVGLTKNAALDYAKSNIRVNAICPGVVHTPMIDRFTNSNPQALEQLKTATPIGRIGKPEEIAKTVVFLCSESASFITGQALAADGGWTAQ